MKFRVATLDDYDRILFIITTARAFLKDNAIPQWQGPYPNEDDITQDIQCGYNYVLDDDGEVVGTVALVLGEEPTYHVIQEGEWLTQDSPYLTIHRLAVDERFRSKGLAHLLIKGSEEIARRKQAVSIRVDTHYQNEAMTSLLLKHDYIYCGVVIMDDGTLRRAYEKVLEQS